MKDTNIILVSRIVSVRNLLVLEDASVAKDNHLTLLFFCNLIFSICPCIDYDPIRLILSYSNYNNVINYYLAEFKEDILCIRFEKKSN